ncbi:hypothetical protein RJ641_026818 [Dillenia turbinata]|uniref:Oxidative stress 3 n=1 Tax=Dillenia turbinata TaxID=194707 RepID=A0AAN8W505_9MAGN
MTEEPKKIILEFGDEGRSFHDAKDGDGDGEDSCDSISMEYSSEGSINSVESSSLELIEDASSSALCSSASSSSCSLQSGGPLFELSDLMAQLPIKRGLSKFYEGKSQSYTSLASVMSIEDLAKKTSPYGKRMKSSKSYAGGLDGHKASAYPPKSVISKKTSRGLFFSKLGKRSDLMGSGRPAFTMQKNC